MDFPDIRQKSTDAFTIMVHVYLGVTRRIFTTSYPPTTIAQETFSMGLETDLLPQLYASNAAGGFTV